MNAGAARSHAAAHYRMGEFMKPSRMAAMEPMAVPLNQGANCRASTRILSTSWLAFIGFAAVMLLALLLRAPAFDRPPQLKFGSLYQDEYKIYANTLRVMEYKALLPHYPYGIYIVLAPQLEILRLVDTVRYTSRPFPLMSMKEFSLTTKNQLESVFALLRLNALFFGLGIIALTYVLGKKIGGIAGGLFSALLVSVTPLTVNYSRMMYYDIPMVFFFLCYIYLFARSFETKSTRFVYYAVAISAVAFSMKQNAAVLFIADILLVLGVIGNWRIGAALKSRHPYLLLLLCFAVIAIGYPTLFTPKGFSGFLTSSSVMYFGASERLWTLWPFQLWLEQAPISVLIILVAGIFLAAAYAENKFFGWAVLLHAVLYYAVAGYSTHSVDRTLLPLIPLLALGASGWVAWISRWRTEALASIVLAGLLIFITPPLLSNALTMNVLLSLPDTRIQALDWFRSHGAQGAKIATEEYTPHFPEQLPNRFAGNETSGFQNTYLRSLVQLTPQQYVDGGYKYLVHAKWNYDKLLSENSQGFSVGKEDIEAKQTGKGIKWGLTVPEALSRYDEFANAFSVVATFTPVPPQLAAENATSLFGLLPSGWWNSNLIPLWKSQPKYILGSEIVVYQVH
jgi:dolichyl-phosphate-mannose-protein mannosyltransferase